ncbi:hypothetical protein [Acinetobacter sp. YH12025]|uniref:hypothetical protein n=1 Tax=Acinetobacter sp. YH12025 TaxID=2601042 RepID=UPI0015D42CC3|nr:hypothetical protein [Acinetobacter sp. YH12025]
MLAPIPATKLNEVIQYFGVPCYKDLNAFSNTGKKKAELKRAMQALLSKDAVIAHTGLGIIYIYENQENLALNEFKLAFEKSNFSTNQAMHYANALFVYGHFNAAKDIYVKIIDGNRNDKDKFEQIIKRFSEFCFQDELSQILEISYVTRNLSDAAKRDILDGLHTKAHLDKFNIPLNFFREIRHAVDRVFYHYFSLPMQTDYATYTDLNNLTYVLDIDGSCLSDAISVVAKMNDDLQEKILDIYEKHNISFGSQQDSITMYFCLN